MNDSFLVITTLIVGLGLIYFVAKYLENRSQNQGALFTGKPSRSSRIFAFFLAILFGGFTFLQIIAAGEVTAILPFLAFLALLYAFGTTKTLKALQNREDKSKKEKN